MRGTILAAAFLFVGLMCSDCLAQSDSCESFCKRWQREKDLPRQGYVDCLRRCKEAPQKAATRRQERCEAIENHLMNARARSRYDPSSAFDDIWELADRLNASSEARALMSHYFRSGSSYALWKLQKLCENGEL